MKKNLFIALFALVVATPTWATMQIIGSSTLCQSEMYYVSNVPNGSTITWDTTTSIPQVGSNPIVDLDPSLNVVIVNRGTYGHSALDTNAYSYYAGDVILKAYVSNGSNTDTITKVINMPFVKRLTIPSFVLTDIGPNETRFFAIFKCNEIPDSMLKWVITLPFSGTVITHYGHNWTYTPTQPGTLNIKLYNLTACTDIYSEYNVHVNFFLPNDPPALSIHVPNPVTTGIIDIQVLDQNINERNKENSVDDRADIDYTLELWSENSRLERTISSTISGEKDAVSMDATGLRNGIYLLLLKVDNKVISTSKLIINR